MRQVTQAMIGAAEEAIRKAPFEGRWSAIYYAMRGLDPELKKKKKNGTSLVDREKLLSGSRARPCRAYVTSVSAQSTGGTTMSAPPTLVNGRIRINVPFDAFHDIVSQVPAERRYASAEIEALGYPSLLAGIFVLVGYSD